MDGKEKLLDWILHKLVLILLWVSVLSLSQHNAWMAAQFFVTAIATEIIRRG
jgi:hypothetical protein